ncbi:hypothetical protein ON010_g17070 [Phytophthora cinnamomi]|nr:hypothetical protein ON010_g17070 [Phytophthora cinnamomi]
MQIGAGGAGGGGHDTLALASLASISAHTGHPELVHRRPCSPASCAPNAPFTAPNRRSADPTARQTPKYVQGIVRTARRHRSLADPRAQAARAAPQHGRRQVHVLWQVRVAGGLGEAADVRVPRRRQLARVQARADAHEQLPRGAAAAMAGAQPHHAHRADSRGRLTHAVRVPVPVAGGRRPLVGHGTRGRGTVRLPDAGQPGRQAGETHQVVVAAGAAVRPRLRRVERFGGHDDYGQHSADGHDLEDARLCAQRALCVHLRHVGRCSERVACCAPESRLGSCGIHPSPTVCYSQHAGWTVGLILTLGYFLYAPTDVPVDAWTAEQQVGGIYDAINEELIVREFFFLSLAAYVHIVITVVWEVKNVLGVSVFTIPNNTKPKSISSKPAAKSSTNLDASVNEQDEEFGTFALPCVVNVRARVQRQPRRDMKSTKNESGNYEVHITFVQYKNTPELGQLCFMLSLALVAANYLSIQLCEGEPHILHSPVSNTL